MSRNRTSGIRLKGRDTVHDAHPVGYFPGGCWAVTGCGLKRVVDGGWRAEAVATDDPTDCKNCLRDRLFEE